MREIKIKIPDFKFPKIKMKGIENIPEVNIDYNKKKRDYLLIPFKPLTPLVPPKLLKILVSNVIVFLDFTL